MVDQSNPKPTFDPSFILMTENNAKLLVEGDYYFIVLKTDDPDEDSEVDYLGLTMMLDGEFIDVLDNTFTFDEVAAFALVPWPVKGQAYRIAYKAWRASERES